MTNLIRKYKIFLLSITYFFYKEIHQLIIDIKNIVYHFFFTSSKKNFNFKNFIKSNSKLFKKVSGNKKKNYILVDTILSHPGYICTQLIIAKFLQKITGDELVILNRKKNFLIRSVGKSYNVNNYLYLNKDFFIVRIFNFMCLSYNLIKINDLNKIKKIEFNKVKIGEIAYDHYVRYTGDVFIKKINFKYIFFFFEASQYNKIINNIFKKNNYKGIVLSETQFIPSAVILDNPV